MSDLKSEDPGFDQLAGKGEGPFLCPSESTLLHNLFMPDPPLCVRHAPKFVVHTLKIPYTSVIKE